MHESEYYLAYVHISGNLIEAAFGSKDLKTMIGEGD